MSTLAIIAAIWAVPTSFWLGTWFAVATTKPDNWRTQARDARQAIYGNCAIFAGATAVWWLS